MTKSSNSPRKNGLDPVPDFTSTISADPGPDSIYRQNTLDYQCTHAVIWKHRLDHEFFAK